MIDFSKSADCDIVRQREERVSNNKNIKQTNERNVHVDYDFADRDVQNRNVRTERHDNDAIGVKISENEKIEVPKNEDHRNKRFDTKSLRRYSDRDVKKSDDELTK